MKATARVSVSLETNSFTSSSEFSGVELGPDCRNMYLTIPAYERGEVRQTEHGETRKEEKMD
jgi:hypothetical protein